MTTPTNKPIPSHNLLDSRFNFEKLDQIVNSDDNYYVDRFGKQKLTAAGLQDLVERIQGELENDLYQSGTGKGADLVGYDPKENYALGTLGNFLTQNFHNEQPLEFWYQLTGSWDAVSFIKPTLGVENLDLRVDEFDGGGVASFFDVKGGSLNN